jgi:hypothetical protein
MTAPSPIDVISIEGLVGLFGPTVAAVGLILTVWWRMDAKIETAAEKAHDTEKALADFKLKVAEEYASWETVKSIETRLTERMDGLAEQVMKMPDAIVDRIMKYLIKQ